MSFEFSSRHGLYVLARRREEEQWRHAALDDAYRRIGIGLLDDFPHTEILDGQRGEESQKSWSWPNCYLRRMQRKIRSGLVWSALLYFGQ